MKFLLSIKQCPRTQPRNFCITWAWFSIIFRTSCPPIPCPQNIILWRMHIAGGKREGGIPVSHTSEHCWEVNHWEHSTEMSGCRGAAAAGCSPGGSASSSAGWWSPGYLPGCWTKSLAQGLSDACRDQSKRQGWGPFCDLGHRQASKHQWLSGSGYWNSRSISKAVQLISNKVFSFECAASLFI